MKKAPIYLMFVAMVCVQPALAQLEKGTFMLGGSGGLSTYSDPGVPVNKPNGFSASLAPNILYFPVHRLAIGVNLPLSYTQYKFQSFDAFNRLTSFGFGPVVRYYFPFGRWAIFPEASYTFSREFRQYPISDPNTGSYSVFHYTSKAHTWQAGIGTAYFLTPNIGLEARLFYKKSLTHYENGKSKLANFNLNIGFQIYLHKQAK
jgi:hypothetical protein